MCTATKNEIDAAKTASKRVVEKTAEATEELIGKKISNKITSVGKTKSKEKENERQEIYIPPEKRQQIIVMPMYNLLEYSKKFSKTTGSFWNYYRDEPNSGTARVINYSIRN